MTRAPSPFVPHDLAAPLRVASLSSASGALAGLSAAVKDMYDIAGERSGGGNPDWLAAQQPARRNAPAVQKLLDAGATITGKTICDEFFFSIAGANAHYGTPVNPRAPGFLPGGSSSGSASAVASGSCDFALGSDTGGSIRVPASFCGIYGLRPTHGRVEDAGVMPMSPTFDVPGFFAATPGVFRNVGRVLLDGNAVSAKVQKVLMLDDAFDQADGAIRVMCQIALAIMQPEMPQRESTRIAPNGFDAWREIFRVIQGYETWQSYGDFITQKKPKLGPGIKERMDYAASVTRDDAEKARVALAQARAHLRHVVTPGTVLALPTTPVWAPPEDIAGEAADDFRTRTMRLTCIAGVGGLPQVSIPAGIAAGFPVGLSFIGWAGGDEALLDLASALSRYCGIAM